MRSNFFLFTNFQLSTEFILVKKLVSQDRDLYRKMDIRVRNVETCWGKTASELTEIKQNHQILAEQVQRIQQEMPIGQFSNLNSKNRAQFDGHVLKCEDEVKLLNEKLTKTEQALEECQCRNKVLVHMLSIASGQNIKVQDKTNLLATEKANKELVAVNEKLTEEIRQLQNELRNTKEPDNGMECTKTTCKSRIEALEYKTEFLESENKSLSSKYDLMKLYAFEKRCSILEAQLAEKEKNETFIEELKHDFLMERTINTQYENQIQGFRADINRITAEKEVQQDKRKKAEAKLKTQIGIFHQEKANQDIELENRNKQIETLVSENDKIYKELQNNSKTFFEFRLQTESNIKSLNERIQNLILENGNLNKELQRNMRKSDEQRLQAQARLASLNINNAKMESDLRRKVDECQRLMQENTDLKTTSKINILHVLLKDYLLYFHDVK